MGDVTANVSLPVVTCLWSEIKTCSSYVRVLITFSPDSTIPFYFSLSSGTLLWSLSSLPLAIPLATWRTEFFSALVAGQAIVHKRSIISLSLDVRFHNGSHAASYSEPSILSFERTLNICLCVYSYRALISSPLIWCKDQICIHSHVVNGIIVAI